jgi:hypothetical protein
LIFASLTPKVYLFEQWLGLARYFVDVASLEIVEKKSMMGQNGKWRRWLESQSQGSEQKIREGQCQQFSRHPRNSSKRTDSSEVPGSKGI